MKNVYDNEEFFKYYQDLRASEINANNLIENPIIKSMLPNLKGKSILDLGCGDGNMSAYFMDNGAKRVYGIDISENMINEANKLYADENRKFEVMKMEDISQINEKFDIVYSSLAFHYVEDFDKLLTDIHSLLNENGVLIFSQENPVESASIFNREDLKNRIDIDGKRYYLLSDYANEGERNNFWNGVQVTKYHRSYCTLVNSLIKKFKIVEMKDSYASDEAIKLRDKYKYEKDRPLFLIVKAVKN